MNNITYTMILQIRGSLEQSHVEIPDVWQHRPKEWVEIFNHVDPKTLVLLIPTTQVKDLVSLLSQHTASS
jgi:hypothetical protein